MSMAMDAEMHQKTMMTTVTGFLMATMIVLRAIRGGPLLLRPTTIPMVAKMLQPKTPTMTTTVLPILQTIAKPVTWVGHLILPQIMIQMAVKTRMKTRMMIMTLFSITPMIAG